MKTQLLLPVLTIVCLVNATATAQMAGNRADTLLSRHETDPQVSATQKNTVPKWNGKTLVNGAIYDNGNIGIRTTTPKAPLHIKGNDETLLIEEEAANAQGTGSILLFRGQTANYKKQEGRIGLVPDDKQHPYRSGAIEIRPQSRINFYKSFNVINTSNLAMTVVNSGIGMGTPNPDASAALDISSASQGLLIPRMSKDQRLRIASPANGLLVYQTSDSSGIYYYDNTAWKIAGSGTTGGNVSTLKAGPGLQILGDSILNTAPDKTIAIKGTGATYVYNNYPDFEVNTPETDIEAGPGIKVSGSFPHYIISLSGKGPQDRSDNEISELKKQVAGLQAQIAELKAVMAVPASFAAGFAADKPAILLSGASLGQNVPNPVRGTATISYTLPPAYASAKLAITDNNGKALMEFNLTSRKGSITVPASLLAAGTYSYTLIVDGKVAATRQMVVAK